ncbi:hypothetical protein PR048_012712 [Dryococelus australis]|uniref:Uncharacterized protein n=1 Tax=Dryococelus australis TaxID=614101 RepID=A0ABQ9HQ56_9NEOP|nr:hypothetical protein PR048_012712 [Dryococelus australis]
MTKVVPLEIIGTLKDCGFQVIAVVSDMGGGNQSFSKQINFITENTRFDKSVLCRTKDLGGHTYDNPAYTDFRYRMRMLALCDEMSTSSSSAVIAECE